MVPDFWDIVRIPNALAMAVSVGVREFLKKRVSHLFVKHALDFVILFLFNKTCHW